MTIERKIDESRNLSDRCKECPYKDIWGIADCLDTAFPHLVEKGIYGEGCDVPWNLLKEIERKRMLEDGNVD